MSYFVWLPIVAFAGWISGQIAGDRGYGRVADATAWYLRRISGPVRCGSDDRDPGTCIPAPVLYVGSCCGTGDRAVFPPAASQIRCQICAGSNSLTATVITSGLGFDVRILARGIS